jgi:hypothetical protein
MAELTHFMMSNLGGNAENVIFVPDALEHWGLFLLPV